MTRILQGLSVERSQICNSGGAKQVMCKAGFVRQRSGDIVPPIAWACVMRNPPAMVLLDVKTFGTMVPCSSDSFARLISRSNYAFARCHR